MFVPLVLLKEKRILYIIRDCIVGVILIPLQMVWYKIVIILDRIKRPDAGKVAETGETIVTSGNYSMSTVADTLDSEYAGFMSHFYHKTLYFEIPAIRKEYVASALIVLFMFLCIWCFIRKQNEENKIRDVLFTGFLSMTLLYAMSSPNPYWIVAMYPMTFLMMYRSPEKIRINLLLNLGYSLTMFLVYLDSMPFVFGGTTNFNYTPISEWFHIVSGNHDENGPTVYGYLSKLGIPSLMPVIVAVCLACLIVWVIINLPSDKIKVTDNIPEEEVLKFQHGVAVFQSLTIIVWFVLCVYCLSRY